MAWKQNRVLDKRNGPIVLFDRSSMQQHAVLNVSWSCGPAKESRGCWRDSRASAALRSPVRGSVRVLGFVRSQEMMGSPLSLAICSRSSREGHRAVAVATLVGEPVFWLARTVVFYVLLHVGVTGRAPSDEQSGWGAWLQRVFFGDSKKQNQNEALKFRTKWHASTKGTLVRRYRVPTMSQGRKLLNAICSLLSSDDSFRDASSHKGCQIRRENAHAESVCCHNVRALLDELPTPHLVVDITVFPPGPITETQYQKAEKIEKVLRTGASI